MRKQTISQRVIEIEKRNNRVEADKAWEVSWLRKISIAVLTYLVVATYLFFVVDIEPWLNALVPVVGYLLSTFTISFLKNIWIKRYREKYKH